MKCAHKMIAAGICVSLRGILCTYNQKNWRNYVAPKRDERRAFRPLPGSPWVLEYPYCHEMITQTYP